MAETSLVQWDEWPSARRTNWDAVVAYLDTLSQQWPSIWKPQVVVCYGDCRQIPPVVPKGVRSDVVAMSVQASRSWRNFKTYFLRTCHRQRKDLAFATWLDSVGDGTLPATASIGEDRGFVPLTPCSCFHDEWSAVEFAFPHLENAPACAGSRILCTTNEATESINDRNWTHLTQTCGKASTSCFSHDSFDMDDSSFVEPHANPEFLHMQNANGVPPHHLRLVHGGLYELTRNFSASDKLMNHTLVLLVGVRDRHVIIDTLDGRRYPLPRICFKIDLAKGAGSMTQWQYPLRMAYACTFHGAQGATLHRCAIDLRRPPFVHGQLYSALARVRGADTLRILVHPEQCNAQGAALTRNVVWKELLLPERAPAARKRPASATPDACFKRPARA